MAKNLFLEIGTEELPSSSINEAILNFKPILEQNLALNRLIFKSIDVFVTPRRIVAFISGVEERQKSSEKVITGPPVKIAYDRDGNPTQAAKGFAGSLNLRVEQLQKIDNGKGLYLGHRILEEGKDATLILPDILKNVILSLSFSKQMTWGNYSMKFSRPVRWITALFGSEVIKFNIEKLGSSDRTYGLRNLEKPEIKVRGFKNIEDCLDFFESEAKIILDQEKRKQKILNSIKNLEKEKWNYKYKVVIDEVLLEEVVNLVEIPGVLEGTFPEDYLYIPKEILIRAIQHHQRYFAVIDGKEKVTTSFITVQNGVEDLTGEIIKGNERVLKARLSDAKFFLEEDRKSSFKSWLEKLKGVVFYTGLGSLFDKSLRLEKICCEIINLLSLKNKTFSTPELIEDCRRAATLCKCDLVTNMVVEFPELQGFVGKEYSKEKGESLNVSEAVFEHYLPRFAGDNLPAISTGSIVSISDKTDTITAMFLTGNIPSGSEDPFALRRKASGIVLNCINKGYDLDILKIAGFSAGLLIESFEFKNCEIKKIIEDVTDFILARYRFRLEKAGRRSDLFDAIRATGCCKIIELDLKYRALEKYIEDKKNVQLLSEPLTRCKNIIKGKSFSDINREFLKEEAEIDLYKMLMEKEKLILNYTDCSRFDKAIMELEGFAASINLFFDKVLVMEKDENIRSNRINIINRCTQLYYRIADFSKIL